LGVATVHLAAQLGEAAARCAPAASVALLLEQAMTIADRSAVSPADAFRERPAKRVVSHQASSGLDAPPADRGGAPAVATSPNPRISEARWESRAEVVILASADHFDAVLARIADVAQHRALLLVPGGGPFADAVRTVDRRFTLSDDAAHWMAVLAMDQYAQFVASRLPTGEVVESRQEMGVALAAGRLPVLAPARWLREADPLPHSWEVTSDSIAAWVSGQVGARQLVVIKPSGAEGTDLVDGYFPRALPNGVTVLIVAADRIEDLAAALGG
jgi:hypothetical protein